MPEVIRHATVAREIARRLRENDARGDEPALRELGAKGHRAPRRAERDTRPQAERGADPGGTTVDVVQKIRDLSTMALDERGNVNERLEAAVAALRLADRFLLGKKKIDVSVARILETITDPAIGEVIASRAESVVVNAARVIDSGKKLLDRLGIGVEEDRPSGRKRRYSRR